MPVAHPPLRYVYFGPEGTFTEAALREVPGAEHADAVAQPSVDATIASVRSGLADAGMVPIENSVEGGVPATLDALASGEPLVVIREVVTPVTFVLAARAGTALDQVRRVASYPHAHAQCRAWLSANLPRAGFLPALSTAAAAAALAGDEPGYDAALCAPLAARRYGLDVLAGNIGDRPDAVTRFVLVSRPTEPPPATGADKTTVVAFMKADQPGALLQLLDQFASRGVNLTRIESRPTGVELGRYCFSIDLEGHVAEPRIGEALMGLRRVAADVRFVGSYPRADGVSVVPHGGTDERAFREAETWLARIRGGGV